jgi:hypothetical protein
MPQVVRRHSAAAPDYLANEVPAEGISDEPLRRSNRLHRKPEGAISEILVIHADHKARRGPPANAAGLLGNVASVAPEVAVFETLAVRARLMFLRTRCRLSTRTLP